MCPDGQSCVDFKESGKAGIMDPESGIWDPKIKRGRGEKSWQLLGKFNIVQFIFVN